MPSLWESFLFPEREVLGLSSAGWAVHPGFVRFYSLRNHRFLPSRVSESVLSESCLNLLQKNLSLFFGGWNLQLGRAASLLTLFRSPFALQLSRLRVL